MYYTYTISSIVYTVYIYACTILYTVYYGMVLALWGIKLLYARVVSFESTPAVSCTYMYTCVCFLLEKLHDEQVPPRERILRWQVSQTQKSMISCRREHLFLQIGVLQCSAHGFLFMLCYTIPYYSIVYYTLLYCSILYYSILQYIML